MAIFRRFDFWVITGFLIFGAVYVLVTQSVNQRLRTPREVVQIVLDPVAPAPEPVSPDDGTKVLPFAVESVSWRAEGAAHWLLEMKVRYRNDSDTPETLARPKAGVVTGSGEDAEPFFLAASSPPRIAAKTEGTVELRYWLEEKEARGELWLEVDGQRTRVNAPPVRM